MNHSIRLTVILSLLWLMLSGFFTPLMLSFGAASVLITVWLTSRMDEVDHDEFVLYVSTDVVVYVCRLAKRVVLSNIDVTLCILGLKPVSSGFIEVDVPFKDDLTKVMYANSITLTPGTAAITLADNRLLVHTLTETGATDVLNGDIENIIPRTREQKKLACAQETEL